MNKAYLWVTMLALGVSPVLASDEGEGYPEVPSRGDSQEEPESQDEVKALLAEAFGDNADEAAKREDSTGSVKSDDETTEVPQNTRESSEEVVVDQVEPAVNPDGEENA